MILFGYALLFESLEDAQRIRPLQIIFPHALSQERLNADSPAEFLVRRQIHHANLNGRAAPHFCERAAHHQTMLKQMQFRLSLNFVELLFIHKLGERVRTLGIEKHPKEFYCFEEPLIPTVYILLALLESI